MELQWQQFNKNVAKEKIYKNKGKQKQQTKILVCCFNTNVGSRKKKLKNGGICDGTVYYELKNKYLERYWIDVTNS